MFNIRIVCVRETGKCRFDTFVYVDGQNETD